MTEKTSVITLHYGGQEYSLTPGALAKLREANVATTRVVVLDLGEERTLTIVVGPNIPLAIEEEPRGRVVVRGL